MEWERRRPGRNKKRISWWRKYRLLWIVMAVVAAEEIGRGMFGAHPATSPKPKTAKAPDPAPYFVNESPSHYTLPEPSTLLLLGASLPMLLRRKPR